MGAKLVSLALTRWAPHVPDRAFRVLVRMAVTALDEASNGTQPNLYFGGRDLLVSVLRAERGGKRDTQLRQLRKALNELVALGCIRRTNKAYAGVNQVYELTLWAAINVDAQPVDNSSEATEEGDSHAPPVEDPDAPPVGVPGGPERGTPTHPPRNHEEPREELREEQGVDETAQLTTARDPTKSQTPNPEAPIAEPPKCPEPGCARGFVLRGEQITYCPRCRPNVIQLPERTAA